MFIHISSRFKKQREWGEKQAQSIERAMGQNTAKAVVNNNNSNNNYNKIKVNNKNHNNNSNNNNK